MINKAITVYSDNCRIRVRKSDDWEFEVLEWSEEADDKFEHQLFLDERTLRHLLVALKDYLGYEAIK